MGSIVFKLFGFLNFFNLQGSLGRCASGTREPSAVEIGLHQGSAFSPFLFAIMMDSLTENIRKEAPWQMMFADDVVLCAREKDVLELELEQRREALEKRGMKVSGAKTEYMCLNGTPLGSVNMQYSLYAQLPLLNNIIIIIK